MERFFLAAPSHSKHMCAQRTLAGAALSAPSANSSFHIRSVSSNSFEDAVRDFPTKTGLRLWAVFCEQSTDQHKLGKRGSQRWHHHHRADISSFPLQASWHLVTTFLALPSVSTTLVPSYSMLINYHLPFILTILPFPPSLVHQRE